MANVHDVAAYITDHFDTSISTMKLQKLCYMAQGWSLALRDQSLFSEDFEAWKNGPVCYDLFTRHRGLYSVSSWRPGDPNNLKKNERVVLDAVLRNYGALSGLQLSERTHKPGTPWSSVRDAARVSGGQASNETIPKDLIKRSFKRSLDVA